MCFECWVEEHSSEVQLKFGSNPGWNYFSRNVSQCSDILEGKDIYAVKNVLVVQEKCVPRLTTAPDISDFCIFQPRCLIRAMLGARQSGGVQAKDKLVFSVTTGEEFMRKCFTQLEKTQSLSFYSSKWCRESSWYRLHQEVPKLYNLLTNEPTHNLRFRRSQLLKQCVVAHFSSECLIPRATRRR